MIIALTPVETVHCEKEIIDTLFKEGLDILHLRKYHFTDLQMTRYARSIDPVYLDRLVLHSHPHLSAELGIARIHVNEKNRQHLLIDKMLSPTICSTSVHDIEQFNNLDENWSYAFLSPLFTSISKNGYGRDGALLNQLPMRCNTAVRLIGLGGIDQSNCLLPIQEGADGIALYGALWQRPDPIENFIACKQKTMERLQYISQGQTLTEQKNNILAALDAGAKWIQVRWKDADYRSLHDLAEQMKQTCSEFGASCIINDHPTLAAAIDADGVHLGLDDCNITDARNLLGDAKIIGGTANTFAEVKQRITENCNYVGLGPFNYTTTKQNLSPLLGLAGYESIIRKVRQEGLAPIPIFAIGGINQLEDIKQLLEIGVYGIALSGIVTRTPNIISTINKLLV